ncbi:Zinc finger, double-stranded RNA binding [Dillenia turbinata]|uniref:Zinc finger, double-stranded RNA binding n=1 Tax=Dillenia turbinata TaxID=194707 RepID=A0AAN8VCK6_9MAGN
MMSDDGLSIPSTIRGFAQEPIPSPNPNSNPVKKKRNLPGNPDPDAEVIALSPKSLMATNRFICEICNKGFQRDQNLQLHRRGHNLPWKLKQRTNKEIIKKKVYICPEKSCVHHDPSRALGDLTGIKKHFSRKHGEKKWKCEKCSKKYAVQSDWKAHSKICGTREYKCDCGTLFSRKDSFITHRAFCDALAEESARLTTTGPPTNLSFRNDLITGNPQNSIPQFPHPLLRSEMASGPDMMSNGIVDGQKPRLPIWLDQHANSSHLNSIGMASNPLQINYLGPSSSGNLSELLPNTTQMNLFGLPSSSSLPRALKEEEEHYRLGSFSDTISTSLFASNSQMNQPQQQQSSSGGHMSATALLQKAAQMGSTRSNNNSTVSFGSTSSFGVLSSSSAVSDVGFTNPYNNQTRNAVQKFFLRKANTQQQGNQNLNEMVMNNNNKNDLMNNTASGGKMKLNIGSCSSSEVERSLTRDFLGVGKDPNGPQQTLLAHEEQELARFISMAHNSSMDSSTQFCGSH